MSVVSNPLNLSLLLVTCFNKCTFLASCLLTTCSHCRCLTRVLSKKFGKFLKQLKTTSSLFSHFHYLIYQYLAGSLCPGSYLLSLEPGNLRPSLWPSKQKWLLIGSTLQQMLYVTEAVVQWCQIVIAVRVTPYDLFLPASPTSSSALEYIIFF